MYSVPKIKVFLFKNLVLEIQSKCLFPTITSDNEAVFKKMISLCNSLKL